MSDAKWIACPSGHFPQSAPKVRYEIVEVIDGKETEPRAIMCYGMTNAIQETTGCGFLDIHDEPSDIRQFMRTGHFPEWQTLYAAGRTFRVRRAPAVWKEG